MLRLTAKKRSVALTSLEVGARNRFVATLVMTNREVATDELLYSMEVGSVIDVRDGLIARNQVFPRQTKPLLLRTELCPTPIGEVVMSLWTAMKKGLRW
jgi:hypothetical protein